MSRRRPEILVIGVGNDYRCDDAVGLLAARKLRAAVPPSVEVCETSGDGSTLMEAWKGRRAAIIIDAVAGHARPGTIYRFDLAAEEIPAALLSSTHAFGIAEAVELAIALEELPPRLMLFGVQAQQLSYGIGLSPEVAIAAERVVERVLEALEQLSLDYAAPIGATEDQVPPRVFGSHT